MIEKSKGNNNIFWLKVINLYEADYNLLLKMFWPKEATHRDEDIYLLSDNQWGTGPKRSSETVAIMNEMVIENHCTNIQPLCISQNDTTACHDHIISTLSFLCNKKFAVLTQLYSFQTNTLKQIKYHFKTYLLESTYHSRIPSVRYMTRLRCFRNQPGLYKCPHDKDHRWIDTRVIYQQPRQKTKTWYKKIQGLVDDTRQCVKQRACSR